MTRKAMPASNLEGVNAGRMLKEPRMLDATFVSSPPKPDQSEGNRSVLPISSFVSLPPFRSVSRTSSDSELVPV